MTNICLAQELPLELASLDTSSKPIKTYVEPPQQQPAPRVKAPAEIFRNLDLRIKLDTSYSRNNYWNDYARQPSCHINYEYAGLQGVVHKQLLKLANRYYRQQLSTYWEQSYLHPFDVERRMRDYQLESSDAHYRWWNRTWYESLPPEKGGQITVTHQIGSKTEVIRIGPVGLTNEGHFSWESWFFDVEDNRDANLTDIQAIQGGTLEDNYNLGVKSPEAEYRSDWFDFRFRVRVNLRVDTISTENKSEIGVNFRFDLKDHGIPYLRVSGSARYQPLTGRAEAQLQLSLLEF